MRQKPYILLSLLASLLMLVACSANEGYPVDPQQGAARLVVLGTVSNNDGQALSGIRVSVDDLRQPQETDMLTYNYAITDTTGHYTIIRYRGRELPTQVTLTAADPAQQYMMQAQVVPIQYDSVTVSPKEKQPFNGYAEADFILTH